MLLIASTVAGAIPAWRAARVRVAQALREEAVA
jgi:ABC-type lipoprotein release transport system permease subunit